MIQSTRKKKKCASCLSTGHAHAVVSATVRVVGKKLVSCKIDVGDVVGHCGAVGHRIAPAINDMLGTREYKLRRDLRPSQIYCVR